jgi:hypothetical protein
MQEIQRHHTNRRLLAALAAVFIALSAATVAAQPAAAAGYSQSTCWGEGCTHLNAYRSGDEVTVQVHGFSYVPGRKVYLQINITNSITGTLLWREMAAFTVRSDGRTATMTAFADCGVPVLIQVWSWKSGSNYQPEVQVYM